MPPHAFKSYGSSSIAGREISQLFRQLYFAQEVIAVGYSFPQFDFEASSVFRLSRKMANDPFRSNIQRLVLVNPDVTRCEFVRRAAHLFGIAQTAVQCFTSVADYESAAPIANGHKA